MGLFWSDSPKDWDKEIEKTTYCYCLKCGERLKSHSFWYCPNPSCSRLGLFTALVRNAPESLKKEKK